MKKTALILTLLALCLLLCCCGVREGVTFGLSGYTYDDSGYAAGGGRIAGDVQAIDVSWIAGRVEVAYHDGSDVLLSETAKRELAEDEALHWRLADGTLHVKYAASGYQGTTSLNKTLTLLLPAGMQLDTAVVSVVSADVEAEGLAARAVSLQSVSGSLALERARVEAMEAHAVSGDVSLSFTDAPEEINVDTVSGNVALTLPEGAAYRADVDTVSGDVHGAQSQGTGGCRVRVNTVSGDIRLN